MTRQQPIRNDRNQAKIDYCYECTFSRQNYHPRRLLGNYIPLKLHRLSLVYKFIFLGGGGGGLKTSDPRLLRPWYARQFYSSVPVNGLISRHPNLKFLRFFVSNCRYLSKYPPPPFKTKSTIVILTN